MKYFIPQKRKFLGTTKHTANLIFLRNKIVKIRKLDTKAFYIIIFIIGMFIENR